MITKFARLEFELFTKPSKSDVLQKHQTYSNPVSGSMSLLINGLFAQSLHYAQKIILGISNICLWLFFSHALILNENPH